MLRRLGQDIERVALVITPGLLRMDRVALCGYVRRRMWMFDPQLKHHCGKRAAQVDPCGPRDPFTRLTLEKPGDRRSIHLRSRRHPFMGLPRQFLYVRLG